MQSHLKKLEEQTTRVLPDHKIDTDFDWQLTTFENPMKGRDLHVYKIILIKGDFLKF